MVCEWACELPKFGLQQYHVTMIELIIQEDSSIEWIFKLLHLPWNDLEEMAILGEKQMKQATARI